MFYAYFCVPLVSRVQKRTGAFETYFFIFENLFGRADEKVAAGCQGVEKFDVKQCFCIGREVYDDVAAQNYVKSSSERVVYHVETFPCNPPFYVRVDLERLASVGCREILGDVFGRHVQKLPFKILAFLRYGDGSLVYVAGQNRNRGVQTAHGRQNRQLIRLFPCCAPRAPQLKALVASFFDQIRNELIAHLPPLFVVAKELRYVYRQVV